MAIPSRPASKINPESLRLARLDTACRWAIRWIFLLGAVHLVAGTRISYYLLIRYVDFADNTLRSLGIAYLILGLLLRRTLSEPERQFYAVDLLMLFFWGQFWAFSATALK